MDIPERIAKKLSRAGVDSRRGSEKLIRLGYVSINESVIFDPSTKVKSTDRITVRGKLIRPAEPTRVWRYHKPKGLVNSTSDEQNRPTIFENLPRELPRLMSIGRLDISSEGLLLLTNDGMLKRKLELPKTGILRKYRVRAKGRHSEKALELLRKGIVIEKETFKPMTISLDRVHASNAWYTVGLTEGRNREIRRSFEAINLQVNRLIRIGFGPFKLGNLTKGTIEEISSKNLNFHLNNLTIE